MKAEKVNSEDTRPRGQWGKLMDFTIKSNKDVIGLKIVGKPRGERPKSVGMPNAHTDNNKTITNNLTGTNYGEREQILYTNYNRMVFLLCS